MEHHAVEDLLILDESAWYAVFLRPTYQSMTHVYTNPRAGMSRTHTPNSSDQSSVTLAFQQKVKTVTSMSCWHMHALSSPPLCVILCLPTTFVTFMQIDLVTDTHVWSSGANELL